MLTNNAYERNQDADLDSRISENDGDTKMPGHGSGSDTTEDGTGDDKDGKNGSSSR